MGSVVRPLFKALYNLSDLYWGAMLCFLGWETEWASSPAFPPPLQLPVLYPSNPIGHQPPPPPPLPPPPPPSPLLSLFLFLYLCSLSFFLSLYLYVLFLSLSFFLPLFLSLSLFSLFLPLSLSLHKVQMKNMWQGVCHLLACGGRRRRSQTGGRMAHQERSFRMMNVAKYTFVRKNSQSGSASLGMRNRWGPPRSECSKQMLPIFTSIFHPEYRH